MKKSVKKQEEPKELTLSELIRWVLVEAGYEDHYMFLDCKLLSELMYDYKEQNHIIRRVNFSEVGIIPRKLEQVYGSMLISGVLKSPEITMLVAGTKAYLEKNTKPTEEDKILFTKMANDLLERLKIRKNN